MIILSILQGVRVKKYLYDFMLTETGFFINTYEGNKNRRWFIQRAACFAANRGNNRVTLRKLHREEDVDCKQVHTLTVEENRIKSGARDLREMKEARCNCGKE